MHVYGMGRKGTNAERDFAYFVPLRRETSVAIASIKLRPATGHVLQGRGRQILRQGRWDGSSREFPIPPLCIWKRRGPQRFPFLRNTYSGGGRRRRSIGVCFEWPGDGAPVGDLRSDGGRRRPPTKP
jgi:hypothetical protein